MKNMQMNEITDDIIHSTQFHINYINRAILANLQHRPMEFGRLVALQATHLTQKFFDLGHFSFNRNTTQTTVTKIFLNCITFINLTSRMLQHTSSEVIIIQVNFNSKYNCTDWELTKLIDIRR